MLFDVFSTFYSVYFYLHAPTFVMLTCLIDCGVRVAQKANYHFMHLYEQ